jgi:DNA-binding transcriptional ArsR family regulator
VDVRDQDTQLIEVSKALSNPTRLAIMGWLRDPRRHFDPQQDDIDEVGVCVTQIQEKAGVSQSTASQYMQTLQRAGLVTSSRRGTWTYYRRDDARVAAVLELIGEAI